MQREELEAIAEAVMRIEALSRRATAGAWRSYGLDLYAEYDREPGETFEDGESFGVHLGCMWPHPAAVSLANAEFIAAVVNFVRSASLINLVETARAAVPGDDRPGGG